MFARYILSADKSESLIDKNRFSIFLNEQLLMVNVESTEIDSRYELIESDVGYILSI
jgi:hypothetical protein